MMLLLRAMNSRIFDNVVQTHLVLWLVASWYYKKMCTQTYIYLKLMHSKLIRQIINLHILESEVRSYDQSLTLKHKDVSSTFYREV